MVGRKRRRAYDALTDQTIDKRQKFDPNDDFVALGDEDSDAQYPSRESGEISSVSGSRRESWQSGVRSDSPALLEPARRPMLSGDRTGSYGESPPLELGHRPHSPVASVLQTATATSGDQGKHLSEEQDSGDEAEWWWNAAGLSLEQLESTLDDTSSLSRRLEIPDIARKSTKKLGRAVRSLQKSNPGLSCEHALLRVAKPGHLLSRQARTFLNKHLNANYRPPWRKLQNVEKFEGGWHAAEAQQGGSRASGSDTSKPGTTKAYAHEQRESLHLTRAAKRAHDMDDASSAASVGDMPHPVEGSEERNFVQTARPATSGRMLALSEISSYDQTLQLRYFRISNGSDMVRCLRCGEQGHMAATCPTKKCALCHTDLHSQARCPKARKCSRCRKRGHDGRTCGRPSVPAGGIGDECDLCGRTGHIEDECHSLWCSFSPDDGPLKTIPDALMIKGCYNCGSAKHWGDDCSILPGFLAEKRSLNPTFSARNAAKYVAGESSVGYKQNGSGGGSGNGGDGGGGSVPQYQLQQLNDFY